MSNRGVTFVSGVDLWPRDSSLTRITLIICKMTSREYSSWRQKRSKKRSLKKWIIFKVRLHSRVSCLFSGDGKLWRLWWKWREKADWYRHLILMIIRTGTSKLNGPLACDVNLRGKTIKTFIGEKICSQDTEENLFWLPDRQLGQGVFR